MLVVTLTYVTKNRLERMFIVATRETVNVMIAITPTGEEEQMQLE